MKSGPRTAAQRKFDDHTADWLRWPAAECRDRVAKLRRIAADLEVEDSRFTILRKIAKRGENKDDQGVGRNGQ